MHTINFKSIVAKAANNAKANSTESRADQAKSRWESAVLDAEIAISKVQELSEAGAHCANDLKLALKKACALNAAKDFRGAWKELSAIMAEAADGIEYYSVYEKDSYETEEESLMNRISQVVAQINVVRIDHATYNPFAR